MSMRVCEFAAREILGIDPMANIEGARQRTRRHLPQVTIDIGRSSVRASWTVRRWLGCETG